MQSIAIDNQHSEEKSFCWWGSTDLWKCCFTYPGSIQLSSQQSAEQRFFLHRMRYHLRQLSPNIVSTPLGNTYLYSDISFSIFVAFFPFSHSRLLIIYSPLLFHDSYIGNFTRLACSLSPVMLTSSLLVGNEPVNHYLIMFLLYTAQTASPSDIRRRLRVTNESQIQREREAETGGKKRKPNRDFSLIYRLFSPTRRRSMQSIVDQSAWRKKRRENQHGSDLLACGCSVWRLLFFFEIAHQNNADDIIVFIVKERKVSSFIIIRSTFQSTTCNCHHHHFSSEKTQNKRKLATLTRERLSPENMYVSTRLDNQMNFIR